MSADVRIIRLIRKNIHFQSNKEELNKETNTGFFATDYFDVMEVDRAQVSASLMTIMGVWPNERLEPGDILAQSFSLYCSEGMLAEETGINWYGDPFTEKDQNNSFPFLSIIQVHIMPDAMQYIDQGEQDPAELFYMDLQEAVSDFMNANANIEMVLRIYKMLSTGDFAIAVRSNKAEASFLLASWIRQRSTREASEEKLQLVLYKTYTLLTFNSKIIGQEDMKEETRENRFVLRGCYSNKYWGEKTETRKKLTEKYSEEKSPLYGINGRYDFSVRITEKDFLDLYPIIQAYKNGETIKCDGKSAKEDKLDIVEYMKCLMCNGYLSYVNERYLIAQEECESQFQAESYTKLHFKSVCGYKVFLEHKIKEKYKNVKAKYGNAKAELDHISAYRKNMLHYMELLEKLILLCQCINESSDTRIYAITLLDQLDVIIDSVRAYVQLYQKEENGENILNLLEDYIRESAWALDGYAQYIRNNNLQSIQTPNYNLETNMSMEKLLIGYGEILEVFINFYQESGLNEALNEEMLNEPRRLLPIVVPALHKRDMSVEVLFVEGVSENWEKEKSVWNTIGENGIRHCMVVSIPVLKELMDIRIMVVTLFHEVAHQFRYEKRAKRNEMLLRYIIHVSMRQIAEELTRKQQQKLVLYDREQMFSQFLEKVLTEVYLKYYYEEILAGNTEHSSLEAPLNCFKMQLIRDLKKNLGEKVKAENINDVLKEFLKELLPYMEQKNTRYSELLQGLDGLLTITSDGFKKGTDNQIKKYAYALILECAYQNTDAPSKFQKQEWETLRFEDWIDNTEFFHFEQDWKQHISEENCEKGEIELYQNIYNLFDSFATWVDDNYEQEEADTVVGKKATVEKTFFKEAYEQICKKWEEEKESMPECASARKRIALARTLGIDFNCENNFKIFKEELSDIIRRKMDAIMEGAVWRINKYREETADLLMCNVLKLSPFGYINLLAVNWPIGKTFSDQFIARCVNVFLFQWCLVKTDDNKYEISDEKLIKQCEEMVETLQQTVEAIKEKFPVPEHKKQDTTQKRIKVLDELADRLLVIEEECGNIRDTLTEEEKQYAEALKIYENMAKLMRLPVYHSKDIMDYMNDFTELKEDYQNSFKKLNELNNKMCENTDPLVQQLGEFCKKVGEWQNDPDAALEDEAKTEKINKDGLDILLKMYYVNKQRIAKGIGDKPCDTKK